MPSGRCCSNSAPASSWVVMLDKHMAAAVNEKCLEEVNSLKNETFFSKVGVCVCMCGTEFVGRSEDSF